MVYDASAGYIITNAHVADGATSITVTVGSGPAREAELVAADANADIAVLRVTDTTGLVAAKLGSSAVGVATRWWRSATPGAKVA